MKVVRSNQEIDGVDDAPLRAVIHQRVAELSVYVDHFAELVRFVIAEEGDDRATLEGELSIELAGRPPDVREELAGYIELVYVLSDDGSGVTLFLPCAMSSLLTPSDMVGRPT